MFKKILLGSLAAVTMTASAYAADLRAAPPPPPPVPVCIWCGAYIGVNGGGAWTRSQSLLYTETFGGAPFFPAAGGFNEFGPLPSRSGGFGGGQIGINWQWGMFVAGGELDFQGARIALSSARSRRTWQPATPSRSRPHSGSTTSELPAVGWVSRSAASAAASAADTADTADPAGRAVSASVGRSCST
jgi:opacity protein-like surface antigen